MNVRTAVELCRIDLLRLIEGGDFRKIAVADGIIDEHLASLPNERDRNALLYHLADDLAFVDVADRPEADACLRAVRALIRRCVQSRFAPETVGRFAKLGRRHQVCFARQGFDTHRQG